VNNIYLLLGSNQGERAIMLSKAIDLLNKLLGNTLSVSPIYETAAWGKTDQPNFLNQAVLINSTHNAIETLRIINDIESELGRERKVHWGQRTIDIDILFFNRAIIDSPKLVIPHPQLHNRRFALTPLSAIAPDFIHPILLKNIHALLDECTDPLSVFLYSSF